VSDLEQKSYKSFSVNAITASILVASMGAGCLVLLYFTGGLIFLPRKAGNLPFVGVFLMTLGVLALCNSLLGMPKLVLAKSRISVRRITGTYYASWTSLAPFELSEYGGSINAQVIGPDVDAGTRKMGRFNIGLDGMRVAGDDLLAELTKWRAEAFRAAS